MSLFDYILVIALGQGFILAFFLLTSKYYRSITNSWLAATLIIISVSGIVDIIGQYYQSRSLIDEFLINDLSYDFLLYVPLFYYFKISMSGPEKEKRYHYYLLAPFVISAILNIIIINNFTFEEISNSFKIQLFYTVESIASLVF